MVPSELKVGDILPESDGTISVTSGPVGVPVNPASASLNADDPIISPLYTRTWAFTGDFKASLQSSKFDNSNNGEIRVGGVNVTNCTSGYGSINIQLIRVNSLNVITWTGSNVNFPCNGSYGYSWGAQPNAGYKLYFSRTGPTGTDENTKHVTGTVYYA
ncbi:hypothetical protein [Cellulomonas hominis]|uniref:hypothetical protein n=1 Tax=Cellulomonas hominis TaxID=156981 RepID=UPI001BD04EE7|nr:hypothetical protein [Cellulomonas hominis]